MAELATVRYRAGVRIAPRGGGVTVTVLLTEINPTPILRIIYGPQELEDLLSPEAFGGPQP